MDVKGLIAVIEKEHRQGRTRLPTDDRLTEICQVEQMGHASRNHDGSIEHLKVRAVNDAVLGRIRSRSSVCRVVIESILHPIQRREVLVIHPEPLRAFELTERCGKPKSQLDLRSEPRKVRIWQGAPRFTHDVGT